MCGLVAIISKQSFGFQYKDQSLFTQMLYADAVRGMDSTGIFAVNKHNNVILHKAAKPAADFLQSKTVKETIKDMFDKHKIIVGHNRAATKGATVDDNAHPFVEGNICLVHNGTLYNHKNLADKEVDSHAICHAINANGWEKTLPELNGAYALIWYNIEEKRLYIARNTQRPLWIISTKEADYIASEPKMLEWLVHRVHNVQETAKYFDHELVYYYDVDNLKDGYNTIDAPKKAKPVPTTTHTGMGKKKRVRVTVVPFKAKTVIGGESGKPPFNKIKGDKIYFTYDKSTIVNQTIKIEGKQIVNGNKENVVGYLNVNNYSAAELEVILETTDVFVGSYVGYSKLRDETYQLFAGDVKPEINYNTIMGVEVSESAIAEAGGCCHECGSIINFEDDNDILWTRQTPSGEINKVLCGNCVADHPQLNILLNTGDLPTCQTESSSSDTNSALLH